MNVTITIDAEDITREQLDAIIELLNGPASPECMRDTKFTAFDNDKQEFITQS